MSDTSNHVMTCAKVAGVIQAYACEKVDVHVVISTLSEFIVYLNRYGYGKGPIRGSEISEPGEFQVKGE